MFGYLDVNRNMLTEEQVERWKAVYCGLCRSLQEKRGALGRVTLSNDMTFLSMLLSSLYEPAERSGKGSCPVHPFAQREWVRTELTEYTADMNLLLFYYHCLDNERDEGSRAQGAMAKRLEKTVLPMRETRPRQFEAVKNSIDKISALENENSTSVDALCSLSGEMLGAVFAPKEDVFAGALYGAGYAFGRFIYLMDAWEDYEEDERHGRFNPLRVWHGQEDYEELIHESLCDSLGQAEYALNLLPLEKDMDLIQNVMYHGVWNRYGLKLEKRTRGRKSTSGTTEQGEQP